MSETPIKPQQITIDLTRDFYNKYIYAKQFDKETRDIIFELFDQGVPFDLTGKTVVFICKKKDNTVVAKTVAYEKHSIRFTLSDQILACAGVTTCEFGIYKNATLLSTHTFYINVEKSLQEDILKSQNVFTGFLGIVQEYIKSLKGKADGLAELDSNGKVPMEQLYVGKIKVGTSDTKLDSNDTLFVTDRTPTTSFGRAGIKNVSYSHTEQENLLTPYTKIDGKLKVSDGINLEDHAVFHADIIKK